MELTKEEFLEMLHVIDKALDLAFFALGNKKVQTATIVPLPTPREEWEKIMEEKGLNEHEEAPKPKISPFSLFSGGKTGPSVAASDDHDDGYDPALDKKFSQTSVEANREFAKGLGFSTAEQKRVAEELWEEAINEGEET